MDQIVVLGVCFGTLGFPAFIKSPQGTVFHCTSAVSTTRYQQKKYSVILLVFHIPCTAGVDQAEAVHRAGLEEA